LHAREGVPGVFDCPVGMDRVQQHPWLRHPG
jgi:hypothetical protein